MWTYIFNTLTGGFFKTLMEGWSAYLNAKTELEKSAAMEHINTLQAIRDVQIAEAANKANGWVRAGFAIPFVIWVNKIVVWDIVISGGRGTTHDLGPHVWYIAMVVVGFYFLHWTVGTAIDSIKGK